MPTICCFSKNSIKIITLIALDFYEVIVELILIVELVFDLFNCHLIEIESA